MKRRVGALLFVGALSAPAFAEHVVITQKTTEIDCAKTPDVTILHGRGSHTFTGTCDKITVKGGNNKLTIENVKELSITGFKNVATVGGVDKIAVTGTKNEVTYKTQVAAPKTAVATVGAKNKIVQQK